MTRINGALRLVVENYKGRHDALIKPEQRGQMMRKELTQTPLPLARFRIYLPWLLQSFHCPFCKSKTSPSPHHLPIRHYRTRRLVACECYVHILAPLPIQKGRGVSSTLEFPEDDDPGSIWPLHPSTVLLARTNGIMDKTDAKKKKKVPG